MTTPESENDRLNVPPVGGPTIDRVWVVFLPPSPTTVTSRVGAAPSRPLASGRRSGRSLAASLPLNVIVNVPAAWPATTVTLPLPIVESTSSAA